MKYLNVMILMLFVFISCLSLQFFQQVSSLYFYLYASAR
uniref:Lipoprotein n=1 Tax=Lepeophtheirus salmonis TaxID=72036 RepID=A0A0K2V8C4_LEPSM